MKGTIIRIDHEGSGGLQQLFIIRGDKMFVSWTIGLALAHVMPEFFQGRLKVWFQKN